MKPSGRNKVVYLLIPTSNHNLNNQFLSVTVVVYLLIPTSNHNIYLLFSSSCTVVYLLIPTSNHNLVRNRVDIVELYIF